MPPVIGAIAGAAATTFVSGLTIAGISAGTMATIGTIVGGLVSTGIQRALAPKPRRQQEQLDSTPVNINETGSLAGIPIVYGYARIAPNRVFVATSNNNQVGAGGEEYLHCVYTISNNDLSGIKSVYFDGEKIGEFTGPFVNTGYYRDYPYARHYPRSSTPYCGEMTDFVFDPTYVTFVNDEYSVTVNSDLIEIRAYTGEGGQLADDDIINNIKNAVVNEDFRGNGYGINYTDVGGAVSYIYVKLKFNAQLFRNGIPLLQVDVLGSPIVNTTWMNDFKTYVDPVDFDAGRQAVFTNPACQLYNYLVFEYGKDIQGAWFDTDTWLETAKYLYDTGITTNVILDSNNTPFDNITELASNGLCSLIYSNGLYKLKPFAPENTIFTVDTFRFDTSNIIGGWSIDLGDHTKTYNQARINYFNEDLDYLADTVYIKYPDFTPTDSSGTRDPVLEINLKHINNKSDVIYHASVIMAMSQYPITVRFESTQAALQLEPLDPVYLTHPETGWVEKKFLVQELLINPDGTTAVVLSEYADIYPLTLAEEPSSLESLPPPLLVAEYIYNQVLPTATNFDHNVVLPITPTPADRLVFILSSEQGTTGGNINRILVDGSEVTFDATARANVGSTIITTMVSATGISTDTFTVRAEYSTSFQRSDLRVYIIRSNVFYPVSLVDSDSTAVIASGTTHTNTFDMPARSVAIFGAATANSPVGDVYTFTSSDTIVEQYDDSASGPYAVGGGTVTASTSERLGVTVTATYASTINHVGIVGVYGV